MKKTGKVGLMVGVATIAMMSGAYAQTNAELLQRLQALKNASTPVPNAP